MRNQYLDIVKYTKAFYSYAGWRVSLIFALSGLATILESVGLFTLMPLLAMIVLGDKSAGAVITSTPSFFGQNETVGYLGFISNFAAKHSLIWIGLIIILLFVLKALTYFASLASTAYLRGRLMSLLKSKLAEGYVGVNHSLYIKKDAGRYINIINNQVDRALQGFQGITQISSSIISVIIYFVFSCYVGWRFALMMLLSAVMLALLFRNLNSHVKELSLKYADESQRTSRLTLQLLNSHKYLISTDSSKVVLNKLLSSIRIYAKHQSKLGIVSSIAFAVREPLGIVTVLFMLLIHATFFSSPVESAFISMALLYRGFQMAMSVQMGLQGALNYAGEIESVEKEIIWTKRNIEKNGPKKIEEFRSDVLLTDVSFSHDTRSGMTLRNLSIRIPFGKKTAIVGESGSGKSTLIDLLTLVQMPTSGDMFIDGVSVTGIDKSSWRKQIGYVGQDVTLFDDTVANNISLWAGNFEEDSNIQERIRRAAASACVDEFIESLPDKYLTVVGERGVNLSGGQRQRLLIARELFKKPRFLILDEATSALDSLTEAAVIRRLHQYLPSCAVVIVSHRFSSLREADNVYVLEKGILIESGKCIELLANPNSKFRLLSEEVS